MRSCVRFPGAQACSHAGTLVGGAVASWVSCRCHCRPPPVVACFCRCFCFRCHRGNNTVHTVLFFLWFWFSFFGFWFSSFGGLVFFLWGFGVPSVGLVFLLWIWCSFCGFGVPFVGLVFFLAFLWSRTDVVRPLGDVGGCWCACACVCFIFRHCTALHYTALQRGAAHGVAHDGPQAGRPQGVATNRGTCPLPCCCCC